MSNQKGGLGNGTPLKAPFPWCPGGKREAAVEIWRRLGDTPNFVEAFAGSAAVLLARPHNLDGKTETLNDADGHIENVWRAISYSPDETAFWCDRIVSEAALTAAHLSLKSIRDELTSRLMADIDYCDPRAAGLWLYGAASWIGDGWCVADGPWLNIDGRLVDRRTIGADAGCDNGAIRHGIQSYRASVPKQMPEVGAAPTARGRPTILRGVNRGEYAAPTALLAYFARLSERLRRVRLLCGDWRRAVKDSVTVNHGTTAIYLDPPYPSQEHDMAYHGDNNIWFDVARWAVEHGDDPRLRIAVSGYWSEQTDALFPAAWTRYRWETHGGYSNQSKDGRGRANAKREAIWFSRHCIDASKDYGPLFEEIAR